MVGVSFSKQFIKQLNKITDSSKKKVIQKQIEKIVTNPKVGKPMKFERKGTREVYIKPVRLAYIYEIKTDKIVLANIYHKDEQ